MAKHCQKLHSLVDICPELREEISGCLGGQGNCASYFRLPFLTALLLTFLKHDHNIFLYYPCKAPNSLIRPGGRPLSQFLEAELNMTDTIANPEALIPSFKLNRVLNQGTPLCPALLKATTY